MDKVLLETLYIHNQLSMRQIADKLNVSSDKVYWWIRKYDIPLRSRAAQSNLQHHPNGNYFIVNQPKTDSESFLFGLGLGIFWGEDNKVNEFSVRLGNTDPELVIHFANFLKYFCNVPSEKIKYGLQIFNDVDAEEAVQYWMKKLAIKRNSIHNKIIVSPPQGNGTYLNKSKYGVIQLYVNNKTLKSWISDKIDELRIVTPR